jgi:pyruvate dehydrogenase phosphatase
LALTIPSTHSYAWRQYCFPSRTSVQFCALTVSMRRAAVQAFRTARRSPVRKFICRNPLIPFTNNHVLVFRGASPTRNTATFIPSTLQSSMHLRNFSLAFISTLVASGAWYAYKGRTIHQSAGLSNPLGVNETLKASTGFQSQGTASGVPYPTVPITQTYDTTAEEPVHPSYRALLVENDQFYATSASGNEPLSRTRTSLGRRFWGC